MDKLRYLVAEVNAAIEVYLSGRTGQQYNRTAFILCDDCCELSNKLFLLVDDPQWSDTRAGGRFKNFRVITSEVQAVFRQKRQADVPAVDALLRNIEGRRDRRNKFFHSTDLLDLTIQSRDCVEAFCDMLDLAALLFPNDWATHVAAEANMETSEAVLRVDRKALYDPSVHARMNTILQSQERLGERASKRGCEIVHHPEDFHLRLAIRNGQKSLRDKLNALL